MRSLAKTHKKHHSVSRLVLLTVTIFISSYLFAQADSANVYLQKGLEEKQKGRRLESLKQFEKAIKYDSLNRAVLAELGSAYLDLRKYYQARQTYKKLVETGEGSSANYRQLFQLSFNLKQYDDAITYATRLKEVDPSEKISFYLGKINFERENYGEALQHLDKAAKEQPDNAEVPYMIGRSYADMENYKQSIPFYQKAIQLDPAKHGWMFELAMISYAFNDSKGAVKYFEMAAEKGYPKDNAYMQNLGIAHLDAGNFDQGSTILNDLLKKRPSDINLLNMLAEAYYDKGKYNDAINYWDTILSYDKTSAASLYMIGICYQKKGDKAKGAQLCDKAIEMDPSLSKNKQKIQMGF
jgi:tetratricopeptide (TPR) repeat protein